MHDYVTHVNGMKVFNVLVYKQCTGRHHFNIRVPNFAACSRPAGCCSWKNEISNKCATKRKLLTYYFQKRKSKSICLSFFRWSWVRTESNETLRYPSKSKQRTIKVFVEKTDNEWIVVRDARAVRAPFARTLKPRPNLTNMVRRARRSCLRRAGVADAKLVGGGQYIVISKNLLK
ncbi:hypothetical protein L9F63_005840, partial [Diploptera punctata]